MEVADIIDVGFNVGLMVGVCVGVLDGFIVGDKLQININVYWPYLEPNPPIPIW